MFCIMINKYVMLVLLFTVCFCFSENENNCDFDVSRYLKENFNYDITESTKITYHRKIDFVEKIKSPNEAEVKEAVNAQWSTNVDSFMDSVYTLDENGNFHGYLIDFMGDSLGGYRMNYYKHGIKDSLWITKLPGLYEEYERYNNGSPHGVWEKIRADGSKGYYDKFYHGTPIDTSYQWWPNGNILEMEVFRHGETVYHKCFSEDGKDEIPCP